MEAETFHRKLAGLDEAERLRVLSRAICKLINEHNKLVKRFERNQKLTAKAIAKGVSLSTAVAKAAFPGLFSRKRKRMQLAARYFVGARLTPLQQEVLSHLFEDGWSMAYTARYMRKHPKVIYEHKQAGEKKIKQFLATRGGKASSIGLRRK
jgi:hypothetical protein